MDLDAYVIERAGEWERLEELARRRRLSAAEADELVLLYQRAGTHLSVLRSRAPDPVVVADLSRQLLAARAAINRGTGFAWRPVLAFFTRTVPAELYRARHWWITLGVVLVAAATALIWYVCAYPEVAALFLTDAQTAALVERDFVAYYRTYQAQNFAAQVWTNNALVAAQCIAAGVLILPVFYLLGVNLLNTALVGGVLVGAGAGDTFLFHLLPHGLLELTCIFVGAGAGLRIGWAWIAPGATRTRRQALTARARSGMVIAVGLVPVLAVAGVLEAYLTPASLAPVLRLAGGAVIWLLFLGYALVLGRRADRRAGEQRGYELPAA